MAKNTAFYVDGFNLYHAIDALGKPHLKWLDLYALAKTFLTEGEKLTCVVCFSAYMKWNQQKLRRHREYVSALRAVGVEPILSEFQSAKKHCYKFDRYCNFREEKQTDVAFASRMICDALTGVADRIILLTADTRPGPYNCGH
jgi:hypothetical protein